MCKKETEYAPSLYLILNFQGVVTLSVSEDFVNTTMTIIPCNSLYMGTDSSLRCTPFRMTIPKLALFNEPQDHATLHS